MECHDYNKAVGGWAQNLQSLQQARAFNMWNSRTGASPTRQLCEIGGGGEAKLKSGGKDFRRNAKVYSGRNHKFSDQKQVISKKKRSSPKSVFFLAEIANFKVFSAQKHQLLPPKKYRGGQEKNRGGKNENRGGIAPLPPLW